MVITVQFVLGALEILTLVSILEAIDESSNPVITTENTEELNCDSEYLLNLSYVDDMKSCTLKWVVANIVL